MMTVWVPLRHAGAGRAARVRRAAHPAALPAFAFSFLMGLRAPLDLNLPGLEEFASMRPVTGFPEANGPRPQLLRRLRFWRPNRVGGWGPLRTSHRTAGLSEGSL